MSGNNNRVKFDFKPLRFAGMLPIVGAILVACGGNSHTTDAAPVTVPTISVAPVTPVNHAPTFASANASSSVTLMSQPVSVPLPRATDADSGDTLTHTVSNLPTGVTYDPATHSLSISPTTTPNTYTLSIVATDKKGASATMTVSLEIVDPAPVAGGAFAALADMTVSDNGGSPQTPINAGGVTDTLGRTIVYSATGLPVGLSINSSTGIINGTYDSNANFGQSENFSVTVTASPVGGTHPISKTWILSIRNDG